VDVWHSPKPKQLDFLCKDAFSFTRHGKEKCLKMNRLCSKTFLKAVPALFSLPSLLLGLPFRAHSESFETEKLFQKTVF